MKTLIEAHWAKDRIHGNIIFYRRQHVEESQLYDPSKEIKPDITIDRFAYQLLLDFIKENEVGVVKTDRTEDLKIINRLLDILEGATKK